jgi:hypothetical protein
MGAAILWPRSSVVVSLAVVSTSILGTMRHLPGYQRHDIAASIAAHIPVERCLVQFCAAFDPQLRKFYSPSRLALCVHDTPALQLA